MLRVKLSTNFPEWPLIRQTPGRSGIWGGCQFFINEPIEECDWWVVYDSLTQKETTRCPRKNTLLITAEPPSVKTYPPAYIKQFAKVISCQPLRHPQRLATQQGLPWMVGHRYLHSERRWREEYTRDYDELSQMLPVDKTRLISVICSDKTFTPGHQQRFDFVQKLKEVFGTEIDVFGRGVRDIEDKWDAIAPYQYHIALENSNYPHYWTEKLADVFLAESYPIYCGCPNIGEYFKHDCITQIDIEDVAGSIKKIQDTILSQSFIHHRTDLQRAKHQVLNEYQIFPMLEKIITASQANSTKETITITPPSLSQFSQVINRVAGKAKRLLASPRKP